MVENIRRQRQTGRPRRAERLIARRPPPLPRADAALVVLTGGGNGNRLMQYLAAQTGRIDWAKVHLFWGDERYVTEDDDERNDKQAREALLDHVDIPARNVHAMPASDGEFGGDLAAAALAYEQLLAANAEPAIPHRILTSICSEWDPKATSTRCFRTLPPCARQPGW